MVVTWNNGCDKCPRCRSFFLQRSRRSCAALRHPARLAVELALTDQVDHLPRSDRIHWHVRRQVQQHVRQMNTEAVIKQLLKIAIKNRKGIMGENYVSFRG